MEYVPTLGQVEKTSKNGEVIVDTFGRVPQCRKLVSFVALNITTVYGNKLHVAKSGFQMASIDDALALLLARLVVRDDMGRKKFFPEFLQRRDINWCGIVRFNALVLMEVCQNLSFEAFCGNLSRYFWESPHTRFRSIGAVQ